MPRATKRAFSRAVDKTFQIEAFDELGRVGRCQEGDLAKLVTQFQRFWINHGWYVLESPREIHGTFYAQDGKASSKRRLEQM
jgi:hypothetical protein